MVESQRRGQGGSRGAVQSCRPSLRVLIHNGRGSTDPNTIRTRRPPLGERAHTPQNGLLGPFYLVSSFLSSLTTSSAPGLRLLPTTMTPLCLYPFRSLCLPPCALQNPTSRPSAHVTSFSAPFPNPLRQINPALIYALSMLHTWLYLFVYMSPSCVQSPSEPLQLKVGI